MDEVVVRLRENGPMVIQLPASLKVVDHLGNEFPIPNGKPAVALCRCGQSANKPFCDGSHKTAGFQAANLAPAKADALQPPTTP